MKVALIVPGGVDRSGTHRVIPALLALIERLAAQHDVHVFALRQEPQPGQYQLLGATVHNIGARPRRVRALAAIINEHKRGAFDVLHAFWAVPQGAVGALASRMLRVPMLLQVTGGDLADLPDIDYGLLRTARGRTWLRFAANCAAHVTVETVDMQHRAATHGITAERLPLGVALDRWPVQPVSARTGRPRLLQVAGLNRVKDHATTLQAVQLLKSRGVDVHVDFVGVDTLSGAVQEQANMLGIVDNVSFHGFVTHAECRSFFLAADALVVSSRHESGPVAALEAAVCGVPVVGSNLGFLADWAPDAAVAVPPKDPSALAVAIVGLLGDPARRVAIAQAAQQLAMRESADWTAHRVLELYQELQSARGRQPSLTA